MVGTLMLAYDSADAADAHALEADLDREFRRLLPSDRIPFQHIQGFEKVVFPQDETSLVLLLVPARSFSQAEADALQAFLSACPPEDIRLLPLSLEPARNVPPQPLSQRVSFKYQGGQSLPGLATLLLNLLLLRVSADRRSVFISYRLSDGLHAAKRIDEELTKRGYSVWRDESLDRDQQALIKPGSKAQQTIHRAIADAGFVLVIDTPNAPASTWVQEEVDTALELMLPVLPVVLDRPTYIGGRFESLRAMQRQALLDASATDAARIDTLLADPSAFVDALEAEMNQLLLAHLRSRRRLLEDSRKEFESLGFEWRSLSEEHLLHEALCSRDSLTTPELNLRLLVLCAPYSVLLDNSVENLRAALARHPDYCQFGVLVHQTTATPAEKRRLVRGRGGHLLLLHTDEVQLLPDAFKTLP